MAEPLTTAKGALERVASCFEGAAREVFAEDKGIYLVAARIALDLAKFYAEHKDMEVHE